MRRLLIAGMVTCVALVAGGCGDDEEKGPTHTSADDRAALRAIIDANGLTGIVYENDIARFDNAGLAWELDLRPVNIDAAVQITTIPAEIGVLTGLTHAYFDTNAITAIPPEISSLSRLQYLSIAENQLTSLPTQLFSVRSLNTLKLQGNQIAELPAQVSQLTALRALDVSRNLLTGLPEALTQLGAMDAFNFDSNTVCTDLSVTVLAWLTEFGYTEQTWRTDQICAPPKRLSAVEAGNVRFSVAWLCGGNRTRVLRG